MSVSQVLTGHTSEQTAYMVNDYPYGGKRCRIRFWLEQDPKKGFRFVSQTENPKTLRWNNPKKSAYCLLAGCMYLDEKNHVQWSAVTEYSKASEVAQFIKDFPPAATPLLKAWCLKKATFCKGRFEGSLKWTIGGKELPDSEAEIEEHKKEWEQWMECVEMIP